MEENQAGRTFRLDDLLLLNQLWRERHLAVSEAASVIQKPIAEARSILERLTESGIVDAAEKAGVDHTSSLLTPTSDWARKLAYVRQRGFIARLA